MNHLSFLRNLAVAFLLLQVVTGTTTSLRAPSETHQDEQVGEESNEDDALGPEKVKALNDTTFSEDLQGLHQLARENLELQSSYKVKHTYIGQYPDDENTGWHQNVNGITHDDKYWYITQERRIWKIDARIPLGWKLSCSTTGVLCREMSETGLPTEWGFDHFGDLTYYNGWLAIGMTGEKAGRWGVMAFFEAEYLTFRKSFAPRDLEKGQCCGFALVDSKGYVYSSNKRDVNRLTQYKVDWLGHYDWNKKVGDVWLLDENWNMLFLNHIQGATFSDDDKLLYLINGYYKSWKGMDTGIHVFELGWLFGVVRIAHRIDKSTNGYGSFNYEYHPDWSKYEEPEGITYWDLTKPGSPDVPGRIGNNNVKSSQLHALLLDNDARVDEVYLKHYRVEKTAGGG